MIVPAELSSSAVQRAGWLGWPAGTAAHLAYHPCSGQLNPRDMLWVGRQGTEDLMKIRHLHVVTSVSTPLYHSVTYQS